MPAELSLPPHPPSQKSELLTRTAGEVTVCVGCRQGAQRRRARKTATRSVKIFNACTIPSLQPAKAALQLANNNHSTSAHRHRAPCSSELFRAPCPRRLARGRAPSPDSSLASAALPAGVTATSPAARSERWLVPAGMPRRSKRSPRGDNALETGNQQSCRQRPVPSDSHRQHCTKDTLIKPNAVRTRYRPLPRSQSVPRLRRFPAQPGMPGHHPRQKE